MGYFLSGRISEFAVAVHQGDKLLFLSYLTARFSEIQQGYDTMSLQGIPFEDKSELYKSV